MARGVRGLTAIVLGVLIALLAAPAPATAAPDTTALDRYLGDALARTGLPGMAVAVTRGGEVVHRAGYGTDGRGPITSSTPFRIASLSKTFTAAGVVQLAERGRVALDAPVQQYLPGFTLADPAAAARVTVRHLLNQTSGIADTGAPTVTDGEPDLRRRVAGLRTAEPVSPPGTAFHYSDLNYQVLALLIEDVTGQPWASYLATQVFAPLGMTRTLATATAGEAEPAVPDLAAGHVLVFDRPVVRHELDGLIAGSGGVVSTADDMARWLVAQGTGGGPVLSPAGVSLLQTPPPGVAGGYAMGWQVVTTAPGPPRLVHTGVLSTASSVQVLLPGGDGFVLLFDGNSALADTAGVATGLAALLSGTGEVPPPRSSALVSAVLAGAAVLLLAVRARSLVRLRRWRDRRAGRPWWTALPGLVWLALPVAVLAALVPIVGAALGRVFTFWQLCLAMPDVVVLLAVAAVTGTALAAARVAALLAPGHD